ncbi:MAG: 1,2-phenylacetyl-CoA epoxidase, subunit E [Flavobacteriia bacterium]|nr:MAG: 1,2-phenylacetyl-CoA epoxidase, subunit E [Flavobacteriia bacterium]
MWNFFKKRSSESDWTKSAEQKTDSSAFHRLQVKEVRRETEDCVSVLLDVPEERQADFHFIQGQYLTFKKTISGEEVRRSYSLCSSPLDGELRVAIKEVEGGRFSTFANRELQTGDELESMTPRGSFHVPLGTEAGSQYVAFASGSGITPVMSILRTTLKQEPDSHFHLFYGNRNSQSVIFKEMLDDLKNEFMGRLEVHHILSREDQGSDLLKGRLDAEKCMAFGKTFFDPASIRAYFLCGPGEMIEKIQGALTDMGVAKERIHFELFSAPMVKKPAAEKKEKQHDKKLKAQVTVILDSDETHFEMSGNRKTVLDAALDAGADVPFACKGAVCCTCRAKVLEGTADMEMNYALEDEEVEEGYVLTCQALPTSEKVVVSYDE